jgi:transcriptional regulator with XRE-family HTH domain
MGEIGGRIQEKRMALNYTQSQLCDLIAKDGIELSRVALSKIETDQRVLSAIELKAIAKALKSDLNDFFEEDEEMTEVFRKRFEISEGDLVLDEIYYVEEVLKSFINQKNIRAKAEPKYPAWKR